MILKFTSAKDSIKNYNDSKLAKSERADCVVRAFASAFNIDYDRAHQFVRLEFQRKDRCGVARFCQSMKRLVLTKWEMDGKSIKPIIRSEDTLKGFRDSKTITVGNFVKKYDKGTYIVVIRGHAFTIKDSEVVGGNLQDAKRLRCQIKAAWQVVFTE